MLRRYPFIGLLTAITVGSLLSFLLFPIPLLPFILGIIAVMTVMAIATPSRRETILFGGALAVFFCFSFWHTGQQWNATQCDLPEGTYCVRVQDAPVESQQRLRVSAELVSVTDSTSTRPLNGRAYLYFERDSLLTLTEGDILYVQTRVFCPSPNLPYGFDYGRYLRLESYSGIGYVRSGEWYDAGHAAPRSFLAHVRHFRSRLEQQLHFLPKQERGVLESLILGDRTHLDSDIRASFATAGAMHILAVSGMHVGILAGLITTLISLFVGSRPLYQATSRRWLKATLPCLFLILYAILTGLSPSVVRSVLMFILLQIGHIVRPKRLPLNTLAASAVIILIFRPLDLYKSGFLLSYSAVLGILLLLPFLEQMLHTQRLHWLPRYFVGIVLVSLCAWLATAPWSLHFFHHLPLHFLLTNIGILPWVSLVLIPLYLLFALLGQIPFIGGILASALRISLHALCQYISWIASLPAAQLTGYITLPMAVTLCVLVLSLVSRPPFRRWFIPLCAGIYAICWMVYQRQTTQTEGVYSLYTQGQSTIVLHRGQEAFILATDTTLAHKQTEDFATCARLSATGYHPIDTTLHALAFTYQGERFRLERKGHYYHLQP